MLLYVYNDGINVIDYVVDRFFSGQLWIYTELAREELW